MSRAQESRKEAALTQAHASSVQDISNAVVMKDMNLFFLTQMDGNVPLDEHGLGLYYNDCCYLDGYILRISGESPFPLAVTAKKGYTAMFQLTNPNKRKNLDIRWVRTLESERLCLLDSIRMENFGGDGMEFTVSLEFRARFRDIFEVRGLCKGAGGRLHEPRWEDGRLILSYDGVDGILRSTEVGFSPAPTRTSGTSAEFPFKLGFREHCELQVALFIGETRGERKSRGVERPFSAAMAEIQGLNAQHRISGLSEYAEVRSDSLTLDRLMERSTADLYNLKSSLGGYEYFAAGLPWFATLFGRDSAIVGLQLMTVNPKVSRELLRVLAHFQGKRRNDWRDEEPGKILHEVRIGEMANAGLIPHTPFFGSVDATLLFLILMARYTVATGNLELFRELQGPVEAALAWSAKNGDADHDGYVEYDSPVTKNGLINQGWKDSGNAIVDGRGEIPEPPIALVEVQSYLFLAKILIAGVYRRLGEGGRAAQLQDQAQRLRERFIKDFWMEKESFLAMGLSRGKDRLEVISSNPGHALWAGILDPGRAKAVGERLMAPDMFNGWGIRTLSRKEIAYNPVGYHLGTVWPHENALIAEGFRRYGMDDFATKIFSGLLEVAMSFEHHRLPEAIAGFDRRDYDVPVRYPVACHPQAWAAASIPSLLSTMLGLHVNGFERRLVIRRPILSPWTSRLELNGLHVGPGRVDLRFQRRNGGVDVEVLRSEKGIMVETER